MAGGAGALGFGGGFGQALAGVLLQRRQQEREDANAEEERKLKKFQLLGPIALKQAEETNDWTLYQELLTEVGGKSVEKLLAKNNPFEMMFPQQGGGTVKTTPPLVQSGKPVGQGPAQTAPDGTPPMVDAQAPLENRSTIQPMTPPDPKTMLLGTRMPSMEERIQRQAGAQATLSEAEIQGKVAAARRLVATGAVGSLEEALDRVGLAAPTQRQQPLPTVGSAGDFVVRKIQEAMAAGKVVTADMIGQWRTEASKQDDTTATNQTEFGQYYVDWLRDKGKTTETATAADRLTARKEFMGAGRRDEMTPGQTATFTRSLRNDLVRETRAATEAKIRLQGMKDALVKAQAGDRVAADQAIIAGFNRIIEPNSVTMVSEYGRTANDVGLVGRMKEAVMRIGTGGSGVPVENLAQLVALAEQFTNEQLAHANEVAEQTGLIADEYGIKRDLVMREFGGTSANAPPPTTPPPSQAGPASSQFSVVYNGQLFEFPDQAKLDAFKRGVGIP